MLNILQNNKNTPKSAIRQKLTQAAEDILNDWNNFAEWNSSIFNENEYLPWR